MKSTPLRLGPKLNLSLLLFMLLLGVATAVLVIVGFNRSQSNAADESRQGLEREGSAHLQQVSEQQAYIGALQLAPAADWGHQAGWFLALKGQTSPPVDLSTLAVTATGRRYDASPARLTDLLVPATAVSAARVQKDVNESGILDGLLVSLFADNEKSLIDDPFRPIAMYYMSIDGVTRYYPATNALKDAAVSPEEIVALHQRFGPQVPARRVAQIHIAGHTKYQKYILDTHDHPVIDPVWELYARAAKLAGHTATLLEWDARIPSFDEVHAEALKAGRFIHGLEAKAIPA